METIVLASGSPRRRDLLSAVGIPFTVFKPDLDEAAFLDGGGPSVVSLIAEKKVQWAAARLPAEASKWIVGADTAVEIGGRLLGKPADREEARVFLRLLSGKIHRVHTGLALLTDRNKRVRKEMSTTKVKFKKLTNAEIAFYLDTGEWEGAAGAYRIQERGGFFIEWVKGSYSNVVGLPLETLYRMLRDSGYSFTVHIQSLKRPPGGSDVD